MESSELATPESSELATPESSTTLDNRRRLLRIISRSDDEFRTFRSYLRWMCLDQSTPLSTVFSFIVFFIFAVAVPSLTLFVLACYSCDSEHRRAYVVVIQLSLSSVAAVSFICLTRFVRKYGLRRFLFLDKLANESVSVTRNYTHQLNRSLRICFIFTLPSFAIECSYKIWWYASGASQIPFLGNRAASDTIACTLELLSWLYRTTVFFLVCVLFRLICHLQILRLQDFSSLLNGDCDVASVLAEHLRIRKQLKIISHRFRSFILFSLILITISQLVCLMLTTKSTADINIFKAGELALCSMTLLTGLMIILHSAAKITHRCQAVASVASMWHVSATIESLNETEAKNLAYGSSHGDSDGDDSGGKDDDGFDNLRLIPAFTHSSISFQKRQAVETYLEHHTAGISVYGFMLDRTALRLIFGIEWALVLWLLKLTISIS